MRPLILILLLASGCVPKREAPATKEECESIIVKLALLGMQKDDTPQSEIDELLPIFEKAVAEVHAGRNPEGFPPDFAAKIREIESDCEKDFTHRDVECVRAAKNLGSLFGCSLFGP